MVNMDSQLTCFSYSVGHGGEGVCLLVQIGHHHILLDCGLADISVLGQGAKPPMDVVLCSHAHSDHARGLRQLHQRFPQIPIYASEVTAQLLPLNWLAEGGKENEENNGGENDHQENLCTALPWRSPIEILPGLVVELFPAGHLPGAAMISLTYTPPEPEQSLQLATLAQNLRPYTLFYTGDFFLSHSRLVEGLDLQSVRGLQPDALIIEGCSGTARHPHRRQQENQLVEQMSGVLAGGRSILLPVPTLGLGQEILMLLRSHHQFTGRRVDIWVDQIVAIGCDAYLEILPHLPSTVQNFARHQPLFWDDRVFPRVRRLTPDFCRGLESAPEPCILLVDHCTDWSGYYQDNPNNWVLFLPRSGQDSNQDISQDITSNEDGSNQGSRNRNLPLELSVVNYLLAQHSDRQGTTQLIHNLRPQHIVFVHGSSTYLGDLACLEELQSRYQLHCPNPGVLVDLPVGETFVQPNIPVQPNYEGELNELGTVVTITLPEAIAADPRWQKFADTGLVEAHWQGDELVLKGLSAREILQQNPSRNLLGVPCCSNCQYERQQRCTNPHSPLYRFKVPPEGYCPAFVPL